MAQRTTCYRSDAGNDFPDEFSATVDDLRHYIMGVIKNKPLADALVEAMTGVELDDVCEKFDTLRRTRPQVVDPAQGSLIVDGLIVADRIIPGSAEHIRQSILAPKLSVCTCVPEGIDTRCPVHGIGAAPPEPQMMG